jgi:hypothetical protein
MRILRSARSLAAALPILVFLNLVAVLPANATSVSQIVLSCTTPPPASSSTNGCHSSELATTPPIFSGGTLLVIGGFWVWCQNPRGGTPYGPDCSGAIYIGEVTLPSGPAVYETTSASGSASPTGPTGLQVTFTTSDNDMTCTLDVPTSPTSGSVNTLSGSCDGVPITFTDSVVQVT